MDGRQAAATLGVGPRATRDQIRQAFRARAKVLHPDTGPAGSAERFVRLQQAAERLLADAPDAPATRPVPSVYFERGGVGANRHGGAIDLTDTVGRPRRQPHRASGVRSSVTRDAKGLSFEDHLAAALTRH